MIEKSSEKIRKSVSFKSLNNVEQQQQQQQLSTGGIQPPLQLQKSISTTSNISESLQLQQQQQQQQQKHTSGSAIANNKRYPDSIMDALNGIDYINTQMKKESDETKVYFIDYELKNLELP